MVLGSKKHCVNSFICLLIAFVASFSTQASHFRGGSLSWQAVALDGDNIANDIQVTVKTAWRYNSVVGIGLSSSPAITLSQTTNTIQFIGLGHGF